MKCEEKLELLIDAATEALDFIDDYVDVVDGDYGIPAPNRAMRVHSTLKAALENAERKSL